MPIEDLTGRTFGRLTVLGPAEKSRTGIQRWRCRCACGRECSPAGADMKRRPNISCGCRQREVASATFRKHGRTKSPEYLSWFNMLARCRRESHPRYADYGGRGIAVCERWLKFENFFADMGERPTAKHTIERIDNDGPYAPGNCRWATRAEQNRNTRLNHKITHEGVTRTLSEWAALAGINHTTLWSRLKLGWTAREALTTPASKHNKLRLIRPAC